ncbi:phosphopentomutase [Luteolibacter sp. LG18]|uniref:phosphopentomutase n=1 Tax=Luteolibacter sp. LG18 TaxID=2819286 RepID=UPI002B2F565A|nr:phosphopentomutase [Luteolibacter sp. LG18]
MPKRALLMVLDSVGCGGAPDAAVYGDAGADTLGHLFSRIPGLELPNMASIGLYEAMRRSHPDFPLATPMLRPHASHGVLTEHSAGKDSTTGHWELMGAVLPKPFATFPSFPLDLVREIEQRGGAKFIGNVAASGTEILKSLGGEHLTTGKPILYTSADSVLQIAAHEDPAIFGLDRLLALCRIAREVLDERGVRIGRVIARPFLGDSPATFHRTANRHDYSLRPPATTLNRLQAVGVQTIGVGKIDDLFAGSGLDVSRPTVSNADGMTTIANLWSEQRSQPHFIFANLIDFDSLYGHRRDPAGYAQALRDFDDWLGRFLGNVGPHDLLIVTGDHGNDPYHRGTDHTREQVPLMVLNGEAPAEGTFKDVAVLVERHLFPVPPEYFQTRFKGEPPASGWPDTFAVVTACNPRSNPRATDEENHQADLELHRALSERGLQPFRVTGGSPDFSHQEPGWGFAGPDLETPAEFARQFDQVAFFRIEDGDISIHPDASGTRWPVDRWTNRLG